MLVNNSFTRPLIHGFVYQYTSNSGNPNASRRWAYIDGDNLFLFPDTFNSSQCYRIHLKDSAISTINQEDESPWITITEKNMSTYFIQPEKLQYFDNWLANLRRASNNQLKSGSSNRASLSGLSPRSVYNLDNSTVFQSGSERKKSPLVMENNLENQNAHNSMASKDRVFRPPSKNASRKKGQRFDGTNSSLLSSDVPPRPPRSSATLQAIKEYPKMDDADVNMDKPFYNIRSQYLGSGLSKRMSITASDLRGKSRDELMLLLLQLNREKANLQRWHDYFMQRIQVLNDPNSNSSPDNEEIAAIQVELNDVSEQLALSEPLVAFLTNMLRMGDLYAGDDAMFASEYRKHLLHEDDLIPAKPSLLVARDLEARDIARTLNASVLYSTGNINPPTQLTDMAAIGNSLAGWLDHNQIIQHNENAEATRNLGFRIPQLKFQETEEIKKERLRLETELSDLETICHSHGALHRQLRDVQKSLRQHNTLKGSDSISATPDRRGPSATLLSKLRVDPGYQPVRSRSSDQRHSRKSPAQFVNANSKERSSFSRKSTATDIRLFHNASALSRHDNLRRFQSIPENLNVISQSNNQVVKQNARTDLSNTIDGSFDLKPGLSKLKSQANVSQGIRLQQNTFPGPLHIDTFQSPSTNEMKETYSLRPTVKPRNSLLKRLPGSYTSLRSGDLRVNSTERYKQRDSPPLTLSDGSPTEDLSLDDTVNSKRANSVKPSCERQVNQEHNSSRSVEPGQFQNWRTKQSSSVQRTEPDQQFTEESIESVFY